MRRDHITGKLTEFYEVSVAEAGSTAKNSMSLHRAPGPVTESVRGDPSNFPFWPGGIPMPEMNLPEKAIDDFSGTIFKSFAGLSFLYTYFVIELLTVPPGFNRGLIFAADGCTVINENSDQTPENKPRPEAFMERKVNLMELIKKEQDVFGNIHVTTDIILHFPALDKYFTFFFSLKFKSLSLYLRCFVFIYTYFFIIY